MMNDAQMAIEYFNDDLRTIEEVILPDLQIQLTHIQAEIQKNERLACVYRSYINRVQSQTGECSQGA
jgi:hypothetical protein